MTIQSNTDGVEVTIDNVPAGRTPIKVTVPAGAHLLTFRSGDETRSIALSVEPGTTVSQFLELARVKAAPKTGDVQVTSDPPGEDVRVDGALKGKTPLMVRALAPAAHTVVIGTGAAAVKRTIEVAPGATTSIVTSRSEPAASGGWVAFKTPIELQVYEDDRLIGTTAMDRVVLPNGQHHLELRNDALEFRTNLSVQIAAETVTTEYVAVPNGSLSVNATPWADVSVDGRALGTTPLANVSVPIGSHEIVWTHPRYGERRRTVAVTASTPIRTGMDFTK